MTFASQSPRSKVIFAVAALPALCCLSALVGMFVAPGDPEYAVVRGVEPAGTFAVEGFLRGDLGDGDAAYDVTVVLEMTDDATHTTTGGLYRTRVTDRRFRVAGLACPHAQSLAIAVHTDDGRGGVLHSTLGGNVAPLFAESGDRLTNVRVDMHREWSFRGTVRDAQTNAPLEGVTVSARYQTYGRDGWSRPTGFTRTDSHGAWTLHGVTAIRFADAHRPVIQFYLAGYERAERAVAAPSHGEVPVVDASLTRPAATQ